MKNICEVWRLTNAWENDGNEKVLCQRFSDVFQSWKLLVEAHEVRVNRLSGLMLEWHDPIHDVCKNICCSWLMDVFNVVPDRYETLFIFCAHECAFHLHRPNLRLKIIEIMNKFSHLMIQFELDSSHGKNSDCWILRVFYLLYEKNSEVLRYLLVNKIVQRELNCRWVSRNPRILRNNPKHF